MEDTATPPIAPFDGASPQSAGPTLVDLGALRGEIFAALKSDELTALRTLLARYGDTLESLANHLRTDASALVRLESEHKMFFEQLKATLVTNRIQLRLELERVRVSQRYGIGEQAQATEVWEG